MALQAGRRPRGGDTMLLAHRSVGGQLRRVVDFSFFGGENVEGAVRKGGDCGPGGTGGHPARAKRATGHWRDPTRDQREEKDQRDQRV